LPQYIGVEKAMLLGMLLGIGANLLPKANASKIVITRLAIILSNLVSKFLSSIFIPLLPIYVFGFCLKLSFDHALIHLFYQYGQIFLFSLVIVLVYLVALYIIGAGGNFKLAISNIKMMLPAGLTAFSTMSSAATMPLTLSCAEKIAEDKNFVDLTIPSTANIHMLGDDLTIVITSMTLLSVFGMSWPDLSHFIPFAFAFSLAKLSCVGIPGASVLVILPVLQGYLGFTPEMISILTIIYTLQDPFGTAANVMGNGAFAVLLEKIFKRIKSVKLTNKTRESYDSTL
jgi:Na+/H+-dicarboxylate symporter